MKPRWIIGLSFIVVAMAAGAPWMRQRFAAPLEKAVDVSQAAATDSNATVEGIIEPAPTEPIPGAQLRLSVEPFSAVQQGQVIGERGTGGDAGRDRAASLAEQERETARQQKDALRQVETQLEQARDDSLAAQARVPLADDELRKAKEDLEHVDILYREAAVGEIAHDEAVSHAASAQATHDTAAQAVGHATKAVADLEYRAMQLRESLRTSRSARNEAVASINQVATGQNLELAKAPASGILIPLESFPGEFAIASDLSKLIAFARVSEAKLASVHPGQHATIRTIVAPELHFSGTVTQIDDMPVDSSGEPMFLIKIAVDNPNKVELRGLAAEITLAP